MNTGKENKSRVKLPHSDLPVQLPLIKSISDISQRQQEKPFWNEAVNSVAAYLLKRQGGRREG